LGPSDLLVTSASSTTQLIMLGSTVASVSVTKTRRRYTAMYLQVWRRR
jgi:hypothetical protein